MNRIAVIPLVLVCHLASALAQPCPCDCDEDRSVHVHELATGINVALERMNVDRCRAADSDRDAQVEIAELVSGVDAALHGCPPPPPTPTPDMRPSQAELDAARALWADAGYTHYEYRYFLGCFCFGPHDVMLEVLDGKVVEIRDPATGQAIDVPYADLFMTVDELFDLIQSELTTAASLRVEFDAVTGHPTHYSADPRLDVVDEELAVRISNLQPVTNPCSATDDCDDFAEICIVPGGFVGCGVCFDASMACESDTDCSGVGEICEAIGLTPQSCACDPSVRVCKPGCTIDTDCPSGTVCDPDHHCVPKRCSSEESCPTQFACLLPPDSRTGECRRRNCTGPADCPSEGFCVERQCYPRPGRCEVVPP